MQNSMIKASTKHIHTFVAPFVRKAYLSIRQTGSHEDMAEVLKDEVTMSALLNFAACLRFMKEYSLCMKAIRTDLSRKLEIDGTTSTTAFVPSEEAAGPSAKPGELDRSKTGKCRCCSLIHARFSLMPSTKSRELETSGNGKAIHCSSVLIEGDNQFSIKVCNLLLILNEMLALIGFQSEDAEGYGHAELTGMVHERMSLLNTEMRQEETLLIELINSVDKSECVSNSARLRSTLASNLFLQIHGCADSLSSYKEIYTAFRKPIDLLDEVWQTWANVRQWPSREAYVEWKKNARASSRYFPKEQGEEF